MVALNGKVRLIALQFNFSNGRLIPACVKEFDPETEEEALKRKGYARGVMVIPPTEGCSLSEFLREFKETKEFDLVGANYRQCRKTEDHRGKNTYHRVRFIYGRRPWQSEWSGFEKLKARMIQDQLQHICDEALWRVRIYVNPFLKSGSAEKDEQVLSINLDVRKPFATFGGEPITVWQRDKDGNHIGEAPLPLRPDCKLRVRDRVITLDRTARE